MDAFIGFGVDNAKRPALLIRQRNCFPRWGFERMLERVELLGVRRTEVEVPVATIQELLRVQRLLIQEAQPQPRHKRQPSLKQLSLKSAGNQARKRTRWMRLAQFRSD
ncbi:hypothetical protein [Pseudomonas lundensis]|uniref:hypothetical protein n=1 Tax=Pseudomonas lundensis TaxID=86185 RepID=UPI0021CCB639|nr:hypothetical protein [Pseudomonas lundensis]